MFRTLVSVLFQELGLFSLAQAVLGRDWGLPPL